MREDFGVREIGSIKVALNDSRRPASRQLLAARSLMRSSEPVPGVKCLSMTQAVADQNVQTAIDAESQIDRPVEPGRERGGALRQVRIQGPDRT
jgi:hypothetical protein